MDQTWILLQDQKYKLHHYTKLSYIGQRKVVRREPPKSIESGKCKLNLINTLPPSPEDQRHIRTIDFVSSVSHLHTAHLLYLPFRRNRYSFFPFVKLFDLEKPFFFFTVPLRWLVFFENRKLRNLGLLGLVLPNLYNFTLIHRVSQNRHPPEH